MVRRMKRLPETIDGADVLWVADLTGRSEYAYLAVAARDGADDAHVYYCDADSNPVAHSRCESIDAAEAQLVAEFPDVSFIDQDEYWELHPDRSDADILEVED
jgi:hypothetical protein